MPLVQTKLHVPHLRPELVHRRRLTDHLVSGHTHKLVLITAPAGFGKTTLATSWLTLQNKAVAWVSLDESDNDPLRFLWYVISALNQRASDVCVPSPSNSPTAPLHSHTAAPAAGR